MSTNTTFHRDGTVTTWDVYAQQWTRISARELVAQWENPHGNLILPTLSAAERKRIERMAAAA